MSLGRTAKTYQVLAAVLVIVFAALPLFLVRVISGPDSGAIVSKVETESVLASTLNGRLQFMLVRSLEGETPANRFVITVDHSYTRGVATPLSSGRVLCVEGTSMDRETYFGEQYLFFGYPQLYISQIKSGVFWPTQVEDLGVLYLSPATSLLSPYLLGAFPFMEEFEFRVWLLILARFLLVAACVVLVVVWRKRPARLVLVAGLYALAAVGLSAASL